MPKSPDIDLVSVRRRFSLNDETLFRFYSAKPRAQKPRNRRESTPALKSRVRRPRGAVMSPASSTSIGAGAAGPESSSASTAQQPTESSETQPSSGQSHPRPAAESSSSPSPSAAPAHASGSGVAAPTGRKIERSCSLCHRRKVRCDKKSPCASCARGGFACVYPQAGQPIRRVRKTTIADVASRISDLEKTLTSAAGAGHRHRFGGPASVAGTPAASVLGTNRPAEGSSRSATAPPSGPFEKGVGDEILVRKGASSQYFDEVLISRVIEEVRNHLIVCLGDARLTRPRNTTSSRCSQHHKATPPTPPPPLSVPWASSPARTSR